VASPRRKHPSTNAWTNTAALSFDRRWTNPLCVPACTAFASRNWANRSLFEARFRYSSPPVTASFFEQFTPL